jgi:hypothetical protein
MIQGKVIYNAMTAAKMAMNAPTVEAETLEAAPGIEIGGVLVG